MAEHIICRSSKKEFQLTEVLMGRAGSKITTIFPDTALPRSIATPKDSQKKD